MRELILTRDPLRLAEAFFRGKVDIEGDLYAALQLKDYLQSLRLSAFEKAAFLSAALLLGDSAVDDTGSTSPGWRASLFTRLPGKHSRARDRQAIASTTTFPTTSINRYGCPDSELDTVGSVRRAMEQSGFEILDVEALRPHYALALRHWVQRLEDCREEALRHVSEPIYRI